MKRFLTVLAIAFLQASPAGAQEGKVQAGWWTPAPVATAPDAADDGLLVQGSPSADNPLAYAAVSIPLAEDAIPATLTLTVKPESGTTPNATLAVCPLNDTSFEPAQGGAAADGPEYSCTSSVEATPSSDGTTYEFDVASMAAIVALAVAIVPTAPTDRVVLEVPAADALVTTSSSSTDASGDDTFGSEDTSGSHDTFDSGTTTFDPEPTGNSTFDIPDTPPPDDPETVRTDDQGEPSATFGGDQVVAQPATAAEDDGVSRAPFLFGGLLLAAAVFWGFAGQARNDEGETA